MAEGDELFKEVKAKGPGGIPVWGYGVVIAGGFLAWMLLRGSSASQKAPSASPGDQQAAQNAPGDTSTTATTTDGYNAFPWLPPFYTIGGNNGQVTPPVTNDQWGKIVEDWLVSRGEDPQLVGDAIDDYLHRQMLDTEEQAVVSMAVTGWGTPPQGTFRILTRQNGTPPGGIQSPPSMSGGTTGGTQA